jgi:cation transporter-like permease
MANKILSFFNRARLRNSRAALAARFAAPAVALTAGAAHAGTVATNDPFYQFFEVVNQSATGAFGISIALCGLIFGAVVGVGNSKPTAALVGVAFAAVIYFSPGVILKIFGATLM